MLRTTLRALAATACALAFSAASAQDAKPCAVLLLHADGASPQALAGLARKLQPACAARSVEMPWSARRGERGTAAAQADIAKAVKDMRQQKHARIFLVGHGIGANAALDYARATGDIDGVAAIAPEDGAGQGLPAGAAGLRQHIALLWLVGRADPLHAKGEGYAYAKAPPHPSSRYVALKADNAGLADASAKELADWLKSFE
jgi:hypothetical protein